jgi:thioredoxin reductase (NADPH)
VSRPELSFSPGDPAPVQLENWLVAGIVVISSNTQAGAQVAAAIDRRFGADYQVVALDAAEVSRESLAACGPIAIALAPIGTDDFAALREIGAFQPGAIRIAVVQVGDISVAHALSQALTLSHVDYYVGQPWASPEEELYPVLSEALRVWADEQQLRFEKVTIVSEPDRSRGSALATMLTRNGVTTRLLHCESPGGIDLLAGPLAGTALPAVRLWDGRVLAMPTEAELAEALGAHTSPSAEEYDVAIVGGGPAGLAAAVYASSEGCRTVTVEAYSVGGQAGTSAHIRNYLGFPWGVRGSDLASAAARQSEQLGAEIIVARTAIKLDADREHRVLSLSNGEVVRARCVILAGGVTYRLSGVESVDALVGHGVFYGAAAGEAAAMGGLNVAVMGGGNSAGQAAARLAAGGANVTVLIRGDSINKSMSDYLVKQLEGTSNVFVRTQVQVVDALGEGQLSGLVLAGPSGKQMTLDINALFIFIGTRPSTEWLEGVIDLDDHGFVVTGRDGATWLGTSMSGVFAAGDIRAGSIKRVAAAVGEGSTASMMAREYLLTSAEM